MTTPYVSCLVSEYPKENRASIELMEYTIDVRRAADGEVRIDIKDENGSTVRSAFIPAKRD